MEVDNNTSKCVDKSINDNQSCLVETFHSNTVVDGIVASLKGEMAILQVTVLDHGDRPATSDRMPQQHVPADAVKGKEVLEKDYANVEEDTDVILGGSDPENTGTPLNGKSQKITIINQDKEMIAQQENVNYTHIYLREKAKKASKATLNSSAKGHNSSENFCSGRNMGRPKGSNGPRILSSEIGCVLPIELKSKFCPTKKM
ncbi:uncharacterized protein DS421_20g701690 [Arachis hypogaea]|nr:uncharacterized protein DS421_20g701690 [Arachis hypogaea]